MVHGEGDVLDLLTRLLESSGFEVISAVSAFRAQAHVGGPRSIDVVIAPWDVARPLGGELYRWTLGHRPELRSRFVFVADEVPPEFDAVVAGRCLAVPLAGLDELVRIARAVVTRVRTPPRGLPVFSERPAQLLADDDPALLEVMAGLLHESGYTVFQADSGLAVMDALEARDFDAIVLDWRMHDATGAELYDWVIDHKPHLVARIVFLGEGNEQEAPDRPMLRKGQDSQALVGVLREIVSRVRS